MSTKNIDDYCWVDPLYTGTPSSYTKREDEIDIPFELGSSLDYIFLAIPSDMRACYKFDGSFILFTSVSLRSWMSESH